MEGVSLPTYALLVMVLTGFQLGVIGRETCAWPVGVLRQDHLRYLVVTLLNTYLYV